MLQKILFVVIVLFVVWRLLSARGRRLGTDAPGADSFSRFSPIKRRRRREWAQENNGVPERLVACDECGTFVPAERALAHESGAVYCGPNCRERGESKPSNAH